MAINYKQIGERITQARKLKGLSINEMAEKIQFTPKSLLLAENGQATIELNFLIPVCNVLGITPNDLLEGELTAAPEKPLELQLALKELADLMAQLETEEAQAAGPVKTVTKDTQSTISEIQRMLAQQKADEEKNALLSKNMLSQRNRLRY